MDRGCTDLLCCLVFVAFIVVLGGVGFYGFVNGDPQLLLTTWDKDGNGCGYSAVTKDYPFLYFPSIDYKAAGNGISDANDGKFSVGSLTDTLTYSACVKECPTRTSTVECYEASFLKNTDNFKNCVWMVGGKAMRYNTRPILGRFCIPDDPELAASLTTEFNQLFQSYFGGASVASYVADIASTAHILAYTLGTAFLVGFVYMIVLRLCGGPIIYLSILFMILSTALGGYLLLEQARAMDAKDKYTPYYQYGSYVVFGLTFILTCCLCCNFRNIRIGVNVMKATSQFISGTSQVFLVPPVFIVFLCTWLALFLWISVHLLSIGTVQKREDFTFLSEVKRPKYAEYMFLYNLFGYLWLNAFIIGIAQFMISAAAALWYFSSSSDSNGSGSLMRGFYWVFRYHLGSIAFGSFLIALVQFIRIIFEYYRS
jgi:hypothetical protein